MDKNNTILQIGAGGVGGVVAHKMAKNRDVFNKIILASRNIEKCHLIAHSIKNLGLGKLSVKVWMLIMLMN